MGAHLIDLGGAPGPADRQGIERRLADGSPFWLDLHGVGPDESLLLRDTFGFHPLAVEDAEHFGQRPKAEPYDDFALVVAYGAVEDEDEDGLVEVHLFVGRGFVVTVHRDECPQICRVGREAGARAGGLGAPVLLVHRLLDALTDSFFPALDAIDDELDGFERDVDAGELDGQRERLYGLRRRLTRLRRVVQPQRDLLGRLSGSPGDLPETTAEAERRLRDVYDHLIRLGESLETYRELLNGANEMYGAAVAQRSNAVLKQLTIVSTVFLPLSFVVGFFGQNFGWMVANVDTLADFLVLGVGGLLVSLALLLLLFRARRWL